MQQKTRGRQICKTDRMLEFQINRTLEHECDRKPGQTECQTNRTLQFETDGTGDRQKASAEEHQLIKRAEPETAGTLGM